MAHYQQKHAKQAAVTDQAKQAAASDQADSRTSPGADQHADDAPPPTTSFRRSRSLRETRSKKKDEGGDADRGGGLFYQEPGEEAVSAKPDTYSPRLNGGRKDETGKHRKIKLGNKAADLFAKLQMKLSSNKS